MTLATSRAIVAESDPQLVEDVRHALEIAAMTREEVRLIGAVRTIAYDLGVASDFSGTVVQP